MSCTAKLFTTATVAIGSSAALLFSGVAGADPAAPLPMPIDGVQAPALSAVQSLSPAIQQAAADPSNAASMLMAAAAAFAGDSAASPDSKNLAAAVNQFVSDPAALPLPAPAPAAQPAAATDHEAPQGVVPGGEPHLLPGVDPAHAVGPEAAPPGAPVIPMAADVPGPPEAAMPAPAPVPPAPEVPAVPEVPAAPVAAAPPAPAAPEAPPAPGAAPSFGPDAPVTQDFMYPSIGNGCLADGGNSIATAIAVAGPATIPAPGPGPGQTAYVFTAVGTSAPAAEQKLPLNVTWVNLTTGKSGSATLKPRSDINPAGPTTLSAIVDTGSGSVISTIFGQVTTVDRQCQFMPTIGSTVIP